MSYTPPNPNGQATEANSAPVVLASDQTYIASGSQALSNSNYSVDGIGMRSVSVHVTVRTSGTLRFQCSEDNSTWSDLVLHSAGSTTTGSPNVTTAAAGIFHGPLPCRYFRLKGDSTGTVDNFVGTAYVRLHAFTADPSRAVGISQIGTLTVTTNQAAVATGGYSYANPNSNSASAVVVKASAGKLHTVTVNKAGASANLLTLYDNASTNSGPFAVIDTLTIGTKTYDLAFANGLTYVLNTGTAADVTITYK